MEILQFQTIPAHIVERIQHVHRAVFEGQSLKVSKLDNKTNLIAFIAIVDDEVAGFKLGYEVEEDVFYSWLGGVDPMFQQRGVAKQLMQAQHKSLKERGYKIVRTYSRNERRAMLLLNIKSGFDVIDTFVDDKGRHKIRLEKQL